MMDQVMIVSLAPYPLPPVGEGDEVSLRDLLSNGEAP
jgi:hypothetical protein